MNPILSASILSPFAGFFVYGLHLIADKKIVPTLPEALIITGSGLVLCLLTYLVAKVKPLPVQRTA